LVEKVVKEQPASENKPVLVTTSTEEPSKPKLGTKHETPAGTEATEPALEVEAESASGSDTAVDITVEDMPTEKVDDLKADDKTKSPIPEPVAEEADAVVEPTPVGEAKSESETLASGATEIKVEDVAETEKPKADEEPAEEPSDRVEEKGDQEIAAVADEVRSTPYTWGFALLTQSRLLLSSRSKATTPKSRLKLAPLKRV
jgi:hypothetical protein